MNPIIIFLSGCIVGIIIGFYIWAKLVDWIANTIVEGVETSIEDFNEWERMNFVFRWT